MSRRHLLGLHFRRLDSTLCAGTSFCASRQRDTVRAQVILDRRRYCPKHHLQILDGTIRSGIAKPSEVNAADRIAGWGGAAGYCISHAFVLSMLAGWVSVNGNCEGGLSDNAYAPQEL